MNAQTDGRFMIGAELVARDGKCGRVSQVVIDPVANVLTHLVVTKHQPGAPRLVPLGLVEVEANVLRLDGTLEQFAHLEAAHTTHFQPLAEGRPDADGVVAWPYYGVGGFAGGPGPAGPAAPRVAGMPSLPPGEVGVRRGQPVVALDGAIGRVHGLVVSRADGHVTHVLLQNGHRFGRKDIAIPIDSVTATSDAVTLDLTVKQVRELPPVTHDALGE